MEQLPKMVVECVAFYFLFGGHLFRNSAQGAVYPTVVHGLSQPELANSETIP